MPADVASTTSGPAGEAASAVAVALAGRPWVPLICQVRPPSPDAYALGRWPAVKPQIRYSVPARGELADVGAISPCPAALVRQAGLTGEARESCTGRQVSPSRPAQRWLPAS